MRIFSPAETANYLQSVERRVSSAAAALYDEQGRVLLVKATYKPYWTFPGGVVDAGETPVMAVTREVNEEVGLVVDPEKLEFCMVVDRVSSVAHTYQFVFAQQVSAAQLESVMIDPIEVEDWALVTRDEIKSANRYYSQAALCWAEGRRGYLEQEFSMDKRAD